MAVTETVTSTKLPLWLEQAYMKSLAQANEVTGQGYQLYTAGPRIADYAPERTRAYDMVSENVGNYKPYTTDAENYIASGTGSFSNPGIVSQYMNPYTNNVVAGIGQAAGRNLYENILPNVNRTFVGGGTFGGSRSAEFTARAIRDANAAALSEQNKALREGYTTGMGQFNTEADRSLSAADKSLALGQGIQNMAGKDTAALETVGRAKEAEVQRSLDLQQADWEAQRDYDYNEALKRQRLVGPVSASGSGTETKTAPGPNTTAQDVGAFAGAIGTLADIIDRKQGGPIKKRVPKMGIGWLKDVK